MKAIDSVCTCEHWDIADTSPRQCPTHFSLFKGMKRLTSVSRIAGMYPLDPCVSCGWPIFSAHQAGCAVRAAIDNAAIRGREVDALFSAWVMDQPLPENAREDSAALFYKLCKWFDKQGFVKAETQVLVADDEVGGILDLRVDGMIIDLKATYDVSPTAAIQVGGYCSLDNEWLDPIADAAILHVTARLAEPKLIRLDLKRILEDFGVCREMWKLTQRTKGKK